MMHSVLGVVLATYFVLYLCLCTEGKKAEHKLKHEVTDIIKAIEEFPEAIAIFDQDKDGDLDCVYSKRVNYDETTHEAAYTWFLQGDNGQTTNNITLHLWPAPTPGVFLFTLDDDKGTEYAATVHYSDYKDCLIIELPFHTTLECVLWISVEVKDNIPQTCIDMYEDNCDNTPPIYSQNTCDEEEDFLKSLRVPGL